MKALAQEFRPFFVDGPPPSGVEWLSDLSGIGPFFERQAPDPRARPRSSAPDGALARLPKHSISLGSVKP